MTYVDDLRESVNDCRGNDRGKGRPVVGPAAPEGLLSYAASAHVMSTRASPLKR